MKGGCARDILGLTRVGALVGGARLLDIQCSIAVNLKMFSILKN